LGEGITFPQQRFINHEQGRFTQRDPLGYVDGMNSYSYADNNPIVGLDPLGLDDESDNDIHRTVFFSDEVDKAVEWLEFLAKNKGFWWSKQGFKLDRVTGNQYLGGKVKFGERNSNFFGGIGTLLTGIEVYDYYKACQEGKISYEEMRKELLMTGFWLGIGLIPNSSVITVPLMFGYTVGSSIEKYSGAGEKIGGAVWKFYNWSSTLLSPKSESSQLSNFSQY
jgi:hypothetical protein